MPRIRSMQDRDRARRVAERTARVAVRIVVHGTRGPQNARARPDRSLLVGPYLGIHEKQSCRHDRGDVQDALARGPLSRRGGGTAAAKRFFVLSCHVVFLLRHGVDQCTAAIATARSSNPPPSARIRFIDSASWRERNSASRLCCASSGDSAESTSRKWPWP